MGCGAPPAQPGSRGAGLAGHVVAGGPASREALSDLLGISALSLPYHVTAVAWIDHALEVAVSTGGDQPAVLRIEGRTPESRGLLLTEQLNLYFRGADSSSEVLNRAVAEHAEGSLAGFTMEKLGELLEGDPELGRPAQPMPPSAEESDRPRSLLDTWGDDSSYADFFAGGELARGQLDSIDPSRLFHFVQHCDNECLQVNPHTVAPTVSLVNYPWDDRERYGPEGRTPEMEGGSVEEQIEGMVTTDLTEDDIIFGSRDKLRKVLEYAVARPNPEGKAVFFSNTCVPAMTGEDVESVVKQVEAQSGQRIFYLTVSARSMTTVFQKLMTERRLEAEHRAGPPQPGAINLLGFPNTRAVREIERILQAGGITVNAKFLPDLLPEVIDRLPAASLNVVYPNTTWQHHYDQLTFGSRTSSISPPAPYGLDGTRAWLKAVANGLGLPPNPVEQAFEHAVEPLQEQWDTLRRRAGAQRLGFVVRDRETYYLTTPSRTWGVPLTMLLEEMGFGLDILMGVSAKKTALERATELREHLRGRKRHTIRAFDSFAFLQHRLAQSPSAAFLSYQFFDWRLSMAGKAVFSIQQFEMGPEGAMRTLGRLLRICDSSFYRRYARYLPRTTEGLRMSPAMKHKGGNIP